MTAQEMEIFSARAKVYIKEAQQPLYDAVLKGLARSEMHAIRDTVTIARAEAQQVRVMLQGLCKLWHRMALSHIWSKQAEEMKGQKLIKEQLVS